MDNLGWSDLGKHLMEWRRQLATEAGMEVGCPWCGGPRVRRSDYIRCNGCGVNWLDGERHLENYLNRNPAVARMVVSVPKPAVKSDSAAEK